MSLLNEYLQKGISVKSLEEDLLSLIKKYNEMRETYLFVYASAIIKESQI